MWVVAGSFHEIGPDAEHTYNTSLVFDRDGGLAATYRKIHLFDVDIPGGSPTRSPRRSRPAPSAVAVDIDGVRVGLSICYDLRFPELYRRSRSPAAPTCCWCRRRSPSHTGRDHWEVLLRARAIENQCYVVAAGQFGDHDPGRSCFGRSMVIDPWGTVVAQAADGVGLITRRPRPRTPRQIRRGASEPGEPPALTDVKEGAHLRRSRSRGNVTFSA